MAIVALAAALKAAPAAMGASPYPRKTLPKRTPSPSPWAFRTHTLPVVARSILGRQAAS